MDRVSSLRALLKFSPAQALCVVAALGSLLSGWFVNGWLGFDETLLLAVGESATTAGGRKAPLGFSLLLQRRIDDYGPLSIRLQVDEEIKAAGGGELELTEGHPEVQFPGKPLHVAFEMFDAESGRLFLQARTPSGSKEIILSLADQGAQVGAVDGYRLSLAAYRHASGRHHVRVKMAVLEGSDVLFESWLGKEGGKGFVWRGVLVSLGDGGVRPDGTPFAAIRVRKAPGRPIFMLGIAFLLASIALGIRRPAAPVPATAAGGGEVLTPVRRWVFPAAAVLFSLAVLEGGARVIESARERLGGERSPYAELRRSASIFAEVEESGRQVYRRTSHHRRILGNQGFLKNKPRTGYRVFLLGGSAAAGWPYSLGRYNIARFLERKLARLLPGREVEVINVAGGTFGSHRVKAVFDEIIGYQPDLILIYSGNNEFLERYVFQELDPPRALRHVAVARILWGLAGAFGQEAMHYDQDTYDHRDLASNRIAFAFGKSSVLRRDPEQFRELLTRYRRNIDYMVATCHERGVPVMLLTVPVNLKDWIPNASRHGMGLTGSMLDAWQERFREGFLRLERGEFPAAIDSLRRALEFDDEHAETWYYAGVALLHAGDRGAAKEAFVAALARDAYPFRALPEMQESLRRIAELRGAPLVDIVSTLERLTPDGISGLDVLLDYVHPTIASQEAIATEILKAAAEASLFPERPALPVEDLQTEAPYAFEPEAEARAVEAMYNQYLIMRQYDKLDALYRSYVATMERAIREEPGLSSFAEHGLAIIRQVHPVVLDYARLLRAEKLGLVEREFSREEAQEIYDQYVELIRRMEAPHLSRETFLQQVPSLEYQGPQRAADGAALPR